MPATITHAYFAKDVFEVLPDDVKYRIDYSRIKMFGQSTDALMFYNLFSIFPGKEVRKRQKIFHSTKTRDYFISLLTFVKENELYNDMDTCSYIAGLICHYVLDSTLHPYIIYKSGRFQRKDKSTYIYNQVHTFMESFLDNDMVYRREKINPYTFHLDDFCFQTRPFSESLNRSIDYSFEKTYQWDHMSSIYYKSLKQMKNYLMIFRRDPYGTKKFFYKLIDTFTPKSCFRFEAVSYHVPLEDKHHYLNKEHALWRNPTTYDMTSTDSFIDLYIQSIQTCKVLICASFDYLFGKDIDLEQLFTNKSYITGLDCDNPRKIRYFEF